MSANGGRPFVCLSQLPGIPQVVANDVEGRSQGDNRVKKRQPYPKHEHRVLLPNGLGAFPPEMCLAEKIARAEVYGTQAGCERENFRQNYE